MDVYDRDQHAKREADALNGGEGIAEDQRGLFETDEGTDAYDRDATPGGGRIVAEEVVIETEGSLPAADTVDPGLESQTGTNAAGSHGWNRREWADEPATEPSSDAWNKNEWAGEPADPTVEQPEAQMPPGESGPQGMGHNPGEQHWSGDRRP